MMAHDSRSTPEPRALLPETRAQLEQAVHVLWTAAPGSAQEQAERALAAVLERMVAEARERALRAEEVVVAFMGLLADLPGAEARARRFEVEGFRERLVTQCIQAYYRR
jgi:hypothetical protein